MKPVVTSEFPQLLKRARESRGRSQAWLAERAGFDHSYVSRLESGARTPTKDAVDRLGDALKLNTVERDVLLAAAGFLPKDYTSLLGGEPEVAAILDILSDDARPEEEREQLREFLRAVIKLFPVRMSSNGHDSST